MTTKTNTFAATSDQNLATGITAAQASLATDSPKAAVIRTRVLTYAQGEQNRRKRA
jgi:hypothetical protein